MIRYYSVPKETFVTNGTIVEPLNVTENGTYAPPAGTAYSPVVVNVEGGGGSSDFSTAEVEVINTSSEYANTLKGSIVIDFGSEFGTTYEMDISVSQTITANVIMYKGNSIVFISDVESTSGAIQSIGGNKYLITGDCTITIS